MRASLGNTNEEQTGLNPQGGGRGARNSRGAGAGQPGAGGAGGEGIGAEEDPPDSITHYLICFLLI